MLTATDIKRIHHIVKFEPIHSIHNNQTNQSREIADARRFCVIVQDCHTKKETVSIWKMNFTSRQIYHDISLKLILNCTIFYLKSPVFAYYDNLIILIYGFVYLIDYLKMYFGAD